METVYVTQLKSISTNLKSCSNLLMLIYSIKIAITHVKAVGVGEMRR
jgi:hypothetical protein